MSWREEYYEEGYLRRWGLGSPSTEDVEGAESFLRLVEARPGARVLDLGCGHGRFAFGMARAGAQVIGLDGSWALLQRAKAFQREQSVAVAWVRADMRRIPLGEAFLAVLMVDTFGNTDADAEEVQVLTEVRRVLHKGGCLVMRNPNGTLVRTKFRPVQEERRRGQRTTIRSTLTADGSWLEQWLKVEGQAGSREYRRRQRIYSEQELTDILEQAGFHSVKHYSDWHGSPFDAESSARMITVACN
jgi:ubiquinone/menaquinone biosynthesis C-methylase UbiE